MFSGRSVWPGTFVCTFLSTLPIRAAYNLIARPAASEYGLVAAYLGDHINRKGPSNDLRHAQMLLGDCCEGVVGV